MNHHTLQSTDNSTQLFCCLYAHSQHTQDLQSACKIKIRARLMDFHCWFALLAPCAQNSTDVMEKWTMWLKRDRRWSLQLWSWVPKKPKHTSVQPRLTQSSNCLQYYHEAQSTDTICLKCEISFYFKLHLPTEPLLWRKCAVRRSFKDIHYFFLCLLTSLYDFLILPSLIA